MKVFSPEYLDDLVAAAHASPRNRQHRNIHISYQDPCQRLFNAIEPGSYIRPHRHFTDPRDEMLIAIRGHMVLLAFNDQGGLVDAVHFGQNARASQPIAIGAEVTADQWHTVVALEPGSVLLEVKAGPFDPASPKDLAPWAPEENTDQARAYLQSLIDGISGIGTP